MDAINPATTLEQASQFGWAVFVLVLVLLILSGLYYLHFRSVSIPESESRKDMMSKMGASSEKTADAMERMATSHSQYVAGIAELKESHSEMATELQHQGAVGRKLLRCTRVLCEMHEKRDPEHAGEYVRRMMDILSDDTQ